MVISVLSILYLGLSAWVDNTYKSAGPPSCHAGEPPNNTNCNTCHDDGVLNSGNASILVDMDGAELGYEPGKTYTIRISIFKKGMKRAGFQSIFLQDNNISISPGTFSITDAARTQRIDRNDPHPGGCLEEDKVWIEHTYNGINSTDSGTSKWTYTWKAPTEDVGSITFYMAAIAANNDLDATGDEAYTLNYKIPGILTGIYTKRKESLFVYPSPVIKDLSIRVNNTTPSEIILYTLRGEILRKWSEEELETKNGSLTLSLDFVESGMYILSSKIKGELYTNKIMKY